LLQLRYLTLTAEEASEMIEAWRVEEHYWSLWLWSRSTPTR